MPWKSDAQRRWGNSPSGQEALGKAGVNEFNQASKGKVLPERSNEPSPSPDNGLPKNPVRKFALARRTLNF